MTAGVGNREERWPKGVRSPGQARVSSQPVQIQPQKKEEGLAIDTIMTTPEKEDDRSLAEKWDRGRQARLRWLFEWVSKSSQPCRVLHLPLPLGQAK